MSFWKPFVRKKALVPVLTGIALLGALSAPAAAQTAPAAAPAAQTAQAAPTPAVTAGWSDGFFIQSADGENRLQFGIVTQTDGRFVTDDPRATTNGFVLRKARPNLSGRVGRFFEFKLMPELAGTAVLLDAYFDVRISPAFRFRSGKDKTPIGYEVLLGDAFLAFPERSVLSQLLPSRDVGFQALGELAGGKVLYSGGIFNGQPVDGTNSTTDVDTNDGKDLAGRIVVLPFRSAKTPASPLNNLGFHLGASTGNQTGALPSYRTSAGQTFFAYSTGTTADGRRTRVTPAVFLHVKSFGAFAEYARTRQDVLRSSVNSSVVNQAWDVTASYVLTGEASSERGVRPRAPFDPAKGTWGALQITARYGELTVDSDIFAAGLATAASSEKAKQTTIGANWFLNNYVKVYGTYERFTFDGGDRGNENLILFRAQLAF